jgi:hypothetical protein
MARIELTPDLTEAAVLFAAERSRAAGSPFAAEWERDREAAWSRPPSVERELELLAITARAFRRLGLVRPIERALAAWPRLSSVLEVVYVRRGRRVRDERAELYAAPAVHGPDGGGVRAILTLRPERFLDLAALEQFVQAEFARLELELGAAAPAGSGAE